jgi:hypothetical protein
MVRKASDPATQRVGRLLRQNTCGETQGLIMLFILLRSNRTPLQVARSTIYKADKVCPKPGKGELTEVVRGELTWMPPP